MKPVCQERGDDCLPACIASLLELPLGVVNNYAKRSADGVDQLRKTQRWLRRLGWTLVEIPLKPSKRRTLRPPWLSMAVPCYVIVTAKVGNAGHTGLHAVVGRLTGKRLDVVHDPSPAPWGRYEPVAVSFLVPAIPAKHRDASPVARVATSARPSERGRPSAASVVRR